MRSINDNYSGDTVTMRIYGDLRSGNCLKVKYVADHLGLSYKWQDVDIMRGDSREPVFLALNPQGQVPVLELPDGRGIAQSNGIIRYLARGSALLPEDPYQQAMIDEWLFWEQYSHEPYVAVCRFHMVYAGGSRESREPWRVERGERALDYMESRLATGTDWLAGAEITIADVALLAYTRLAPEGGFELESRPFVSAWIARAERELGL